MTNNNWTPQERAALAIEKWVACCAGRRWHRMYIATCAGRPSPAPRSPACRRWPPHQRTAVAVEKWAAYCAGRAWYRKLLKARAAA